ncbi:MAG TPA: hypothetical protein VFU65_20565 [Actinocrinis sp.]|nr:hypothetical protein [Actinocrinis sp.]
MPVHTGGPAGTHRGAGKKLDYLPVPWMPSGLTTLSVPPMPLTWTAAEAMAGAATATSVILASALHG